MVEEELDKEEEWGEGEMEEMREGTGEGEWSPPPENLLKHKYF